MKIRKILFRVGIFFLAVGGVAGAGQVFSDTAATVTIRIEGEEVTWWSGRVEMAGCTITDEVGGEHNLGATAACALEAAAGTAGFGTVWQDFGFGLLINTVGWDATLADWSKSWSFWVNGVPASVGMDAYVAQEGDELWLMYSAWPAVPLRVRGPAEIKAGSEGTFLVEKLTGDYDENFQWQGAWMAAPEARVKVGGERGELNEAGALIWSFDQVGTVGIQAVGEGLVRSEVWNVAVSDLLDPDEGEGPKDNDSQENGSETAGIENEVDEENRVEEEVLGPGEEVLEDAARKALNFMKSQQEVDGGIGGKLVAGWATMALAADGQAAGEVQNGGNSLLSYLAKIETKSMTDLEKLVLSVRAAGYDPRQWAGRDLVEELEKAVRVGGTRETELANDEIFGLLAFRAAGLPHDHEIMRQLFQDIKAGQEENGSWGSIDLTAAAVQALAAYHQGGGEKADSEMVKALEYLHSRQDSKGGFGNNSASSAWVIQALIAAGEDPADWRKGERNPWQALLDYQADGGGFGWQSTEDVSLLMTAYAISALLGQPWPIIGQAGEGDEELITKTETVPAGAVLAGSILGTSSQMVGFAQLAEAAAGSAAESARNGVVGDAGEDVAREESRERVAVNQEDTETSKFQNATDTSGERRRSYYFLWSLFGLANIGLGSTLTRLVINL